ncbi:family 78 glycoside hydrolase catalytic domain [Streptomyces sp. ITFR-16]|uniref:family 78 glycoside hydrolase catalytic domain n=1 Tax=Streptomyces sp. ITFR-16 TaxID=3075198 RepID=UPI00288BDE29|nr:family 78 glycoside hydrolase catalytic domain [Streptomyces sp. ITFR-16]WNI27273.1 family 78 glycoside hydrolase catalytic domain [Streptomyces sp. ITFR-16]
MSELISRRRLLQVSGAAPVALALAGPGTAVAGEGPAARHAPTKLLTDLLPQGLGVAARGQPRLNWQVPDLGTQTRQRAYQVQFATTPDGLDRGRLVWDSGKITSAASTAVAYAGPALKPRTAYWWRVRCWGERGRGASAWSRPVLLATAVEDKWTAEPIWVPSGPTLGDGTFSSRVRITSEAAGLWFRALDPSHNYLWQLRASHEAGVLRKHICVDGTYTVLGEVTLPFAVDSGQWLDLSVTMKGNTFTTRIGDTLVDTTVDGRYAKGTVGLRNGRTEAQVYDFVRFTDADGVVRLEDDFSTDKGTFGAGTVIDGHLALTGGESSLAAYGPDNAWALLRHTYRLTPRKEVAAAVLYVAATSPDPARQYVAKVFSNGHVVAHASVRAASGVAYQAFDITATVRAGRTNAIAALCHSTKDRAFLAQLEVTHTDGTRTTVATGKSWKACRQGGLLPDRGSMGTGFYSAPQEYWDMRHEPVGWTGPDFDDRSWTAPVTRPALAGLAPALLEPVRLHDVEPAAVTEVANGRWLVDLGREIAGGLSLETTGRDGAKIEVRLGEELQADGTVRDVLRGGNTYRETWTLRDGPQHIEHWGYRGFRWAELRTDLDLSRATVRGRAWRLDWDDDVVSFDSSNHDLNRVWELCRWSIEATRGDLYQDTPTRERGPYEGDAFVNQLSEYALQRSYALARRSNAYLVRKGTWPTEYRLMCALSAWEDYLATGDDRQLAEDYELLDGKNLTRYLGDDGLVHKEPGQSSAALSDLVDWPETNRDGYVFTEVNTVVNAFQFAAFEALARCADVLGRTGDAALLRRRAERLSEAMRTHLLDRSAGRFTDGAGTAHSAQHATAFPVALGVTDALPDAVRRDLGATLAAGGMRMSVYGAQFLLDALFRLGRADAALSLLTSRGTSSWLHMLDGLHATIVTEAWDPAQKPNMTFSHAWASAPANAIARHVLGVQVTDPGAAGFLIRPRTGSLRDVKGTVPSLRGTVSVAHHRSGDAHSLQVRLPPHTHAAVELEIGKAPAASYEAMTADGLRSVHLTARTDLTGIVLRLDRVEAGTTVIRRRR